MRTATKCRLLALLFAVPTMCSLCSCTPNATVPAAKMPTAKTTDEAMAEGCTRLLFTVPSASMKRDIRAAVVLPPQYAANPSASFPVLYALHGARAPYTTYTDMAPLRKFMVDHPMILVCFSGDAVSCYIDSTRKPESQFTTFFFDELIPYIDKNYRTNGLRGVTGFSMGGGGAFRYTLMRPEMFVGVSSLSGSLAGFGPPKSGARPRGSALSLLGPYEANKDAYERYAVHALLKKRVAEAVRLPAMMLRCGTEDFLLNASRDFVTLLIEQNAKIKKTRIDPLLKVITDKQAKRKKLELLRKTMMLDFEYTESPGAHNWPYWVGQSRATAEFHWRCFEAARMEAAK